MVGGKLQSSLIFKPQPLAARLVGQLGEDRLSGSLLLTPALAPALPQTTAVAACSNLVKAWMLAAKHLDGGSKAAVT